MTRLIFHPSASQPSRPSVVPSADWLLYLGFVCLGGGIAAALLGAALLTAAWLPEYHFLHRPGVWLLFSLLPALLLGGLALDRYEARTRLHGR
ncbi:MAG: hypothetical protein SF339_19895 [Blastocatellia bacterium]|nr:hypothetical protein [Blastocatellia bacterium]